MACVLLVFWWGVLRQIDLPGFYMDSVNPDYLAARILNPALKNPIGTLPTATIPILGNLYHGVQNLYVDLVVFAIAGISVPSIRISQALFGAGIVACLFALVLRSSGSRACAVSAGLLLATDVGFIASFRTQSFIVLGGQVWLLASLLALSHGTRRGHFLSGVFYGLSIYGYFVYGFFLPAMALLVLGAQDRQPRAWIAGLVVGMLPYAAGYASLVVALGGPAPALEWLGDTLRSMAPLSSQAAGWEKVDVTFRNARLALANTGNELIVFDRPVAWPWAQVKETVLVGAVGLALALSFAWRELRVAWLVVAYLAVGSFFGSRLWVHHFTVLIALAYLCLGLLLARLAPRRHAAAWILAVGAAGCGLNLVQAGAFHERLAQTGGKGHASDALTRLALEARSDEATLYVFPEWGFHMSFALLTANRVPFVLDTSRIAPARGDRKAVAIAFWDEKDEPRYAAALLAAGAVGTETTVYRQRDGGAAFRVVRGTIP